jgi:lipoprotein-anchoring transpeptidase ErfK/SrfK
MYRTSTTHPLQSFRFWFLVLGCIGATSAWRMGWFADPKPESEVTQAEIDLSGLDVSQLEVEEPEATTGAAGSAAGHLPNTIATETALPESVATAQSEPATGDEASVAAPDRAGSQVRTAAHQQVEADASFASSPFGRRDLEFVPADTFERPTPEDDVQHFSATPEIQQAVNEEVAVEDGPQATVLGNDTAFFPEETAPPSIDWVAIDRLINAGRDVEAHRQLSSLYWEHPELRSKLKDRIEQTAQRIYFQPTPHYVDAYVFQPGDLLQDIAPQYQVSWQYLAKLNRTDPRRLQAGKQLKVIQGPFDAVVDLRRFELTVHAHGYFVASFPIGVGQDNSTPVGEFTVDDKLEDPTYYGPEQVIANDDPTNPLGEHWISIGNGYGLHGTIDEGSIGRAESRGCVRLRNQDIADLYDLLIVGSQVVIRP